MPTVPGRELTARTTGLHIHSPYPQGLQKSLGHKEGQMKAARDALERQGNAVNLKSFLPTVVTMKLACRGTNVAAGSPGMQATKQEDLHFTLGSTNAEVKKIKAFTYFSTDFSPLLCKSQVPG